MSALTVGWSRAENAADLPRDSSVVVPPRRLTVGWRPMLSSAVLDWDPKDLVVTPGAGVDPGPVEPEPGMPGEPGTPGDPGTPAAPGGGGAAEAGGGASAGAGGATGGGAAGSGASKDAASGTLDVRVAVRRTMSLFREHGLVVDVVAPADAEVSAVLLASVTQRRGSRLVGPTRRRMTRTRKASAKAGKRTRIVLPISTDGRRAIRDYDSLKATLHVVATERGGRKVAAEKPVQLIARAITATPTKEATRKKR